MKKHFTQVLYLLALCLVMSTNPMFGQTYFGDSVGDPIPDSGTLGPFTSVTSVPVSGQIGINASIDEVTLDLLHTFDGDLDISLIAPSGNSVLLSGSNGGAGDDYLGTSFVDGNPSISSTGAPPFTDVFGADGGLMNTILFGECILGDWTLFIDDRLGGDSGTFLGFSITFTTTGEECPPPPVFDDCTAYFGDSVGDPIPDTGTSGPFESEIPVSATGTIGVDAIIESVELDLLHTFDGDLDISLIAPSGASVKLSDNRGGAGDNFSGTVFTDSAMLPLASDSPPFTGSFKADGGNMNSVLALESIFGTWRLFITDDLGGDSGTFLGVTLNICTMGDPCGDGSLPIGWDHDNVGGATGDAYYDACSDIFCVESNGITHPLSDKIHFAHKYVCGDFVFEARVISITNGGLGGIRVSESLDGNSKKVAMRTQLAPFVHRDVRYMTGGYQNTQQLFKPNHSYLRLERMGNLFKGYTSTNGFTWTFAFFASVNMNSCVYVGLFAEGPIDNVISQVCFDEVYCESEGGPELVEAPDGNVTTAARYGSNFSVFPNPASDVLNADLGSFIGQKVDLSIYNELGQLVKQIQIDEVQLPTEQIRLDGLQTGSYFIEARTELDKTTQKFIIVK